MKPPSLQSACISLIITVLALIAVQSAKANVIHVPMDQTTIQAAINAAANGDTVLVAPGTYKEDIDFMGKAITVTSSGGAQVTIIDGGAVNSVVTFKTNETSSSILNGFTITNGFGSYDGGGILISGSSPTITNNIIANNKACDGAGMYVSFGGPLIQGNIISNNIQSGCSGGVGGGGIELIGASIGAQVIGNAITGNNPVSGYDGGGIGLWTPGPALIRSNFISGNTAGTGGGIGGANDTSDVRIIQNVITGNTATTGGGLEIDNTVALILNNTIAGNNAQGYGSALFGVFFTTTGPMSVINNLIISNTGQSALGCRVFDTVNPPVFSFNDVFSSAGTAYGTGCVSQTGTNGNISADPLFVNAASSDYDLRVGSPAIDVGNNAAPNLLPKDIDGDNRIINATGLSTAIIDMGADEFSNAQVLTLSSGALVFGAQLVFTTSPSQSVTFTNHGPGAININAVLSAGDFSQANNCGTSLATGASCTVIVTFTPTARGVRSGVLAIMTDASESPQAVILSGTGTGPVVSLSTSSLFFSNQVLHTTSPAQQVKVSNTGEAPLTFASIVPSGDFALISSGTACSTASPVTPGANCTLSVTFTPTATGTGNGQVTLTDNASDSPQIVQLSGQGINQGIVSLSAQTLSFGGRLEGATSAAQMLTLTNTGSTSLTIFNISVNGDFAAPNNCPISPTTIGVGAGCTFSVTFKPTALGRRNGSISISDNGVGSLQNVSLTGFGIGEAGDFVGDRVADYAVFRPSNGTWYVLDSNGSTVLVRQWGTSGDVPVHGDYDGDGKTDFAVFRPSTGQWFIIPSSNPGSPIVQQWGTNGDIPVPGDYDGDGKTDFAVFRASTGTWFIIPSSNPGTPIVQQWGTNGDIPVPGDYDGDGKTDFAVFRPSTGTWYIVPSGNPVSPIVQQWGTNGDIPAPGDYDGDSKTDFAIFRPSTGTWYIIPSSNPGTPTVKQWGTNGDIPVPVDYDGDGKTDIAVWRPATGIWYVIPSSAPGTFTVTQWGTNGDIPIHRLAASTAD